MKKSFTKVCNEALAAELNYAELLVKDPEKCLLPVLTDYTDKLSSVIVYDREEHEIYNPIAWPICLSPKFSKDFLKSMDEQIDRVYKECFPILVNHFRINLFLTPWAYHMLHKDDNK